MGQAIGDILPFAVGIAISPVPLIAIILMLITPRARSNGLAFLGGWIGGLLVVGAIVLVAANYAGVSTSHEASRLDSLIRIGLGILLLVLAGQQWRDRPQAGEEGPMPHWMGTLDAFTPLRSAAVASLLSGINPKNLILNLGAVSIIAQTGMSNFRQVVLLLVLVVIASLSMIVPLAIYFAMGARSERVLGEWKGWLARNNATVMFVLFIVFGFVLVGKGIGGLG